MTGGEPLSHPDFNKIYKLFKYNGFIVSIKTNSLLLNNNHIDLFRKLPPSQLNITVYGLSDDEYYEYCGDKFGFTKLEKSLGLLQQNNVRFSLCTIADKFHYPRIINSDYSKYFKKYNRDVEFNYDLYDTNEGDKNPLSLRINNDKIIEVEKEQFLANNKKFLNNNPIGNMESLSCKGGICNVAIDSNGNISVCLMDKKKIKIDFENWDNLKKYMIDRNHEIENMFLNSKCNGCKEAFLCEKCPFWHSRTINENINGFDRCELANLKRNLFIPISIPDDILV